MLKSSFIFPEFIFLSSICDKISYDSISSMFLFALSLRNFSGNSDIISDVKEWNVDIFTL
jgi:hypothetical protein